MQNILSKQTFYYLMLIVVLFFLKLALTPPFFNMPYYEMINDLRVLSGSFFSRLLHGDANYTNFFTSFIGFITLRVFKVIEYFPQAVSLIGILLSACTVSLLCTKTFECIISDLKLRIILIFCLYLVPFSELSLYYNLTYYMCILAIYVIIKLFTVNKLSNFEVFTIIFFTPFFVLGKPIFFSFGAGFAFLFAYELYKWVRRDRREIRHISCLIYINLLYAFQAWYTLFYGMQLKGESQVDYLLVIQKLFSFWGIYVSSVVANFVSRNFADIFGFYCGIILCVLFICCIVKILRQKNMLQLIIFSMLFLSAVVAIYGTLAHQPQYRELYLSLEYFFWTNRTFFSFVLLSLFTICFLINDLKLAYKKNCYILLIVYCLLGFSVTKTYERITSFPWSKTQVLVNEPFVYLPSACAPMFYYANRIWNFHWNIPSLISGEGSITLEREIAGGKVMYVVISQALNNTSFALPETAFMSITDDSNVYSAKLINPGLNEFYLFKFDEFVDSELFKTVKINSDKKILFNKKITMSLIGQ